MLETQLLLRNILLKLLNKIASTYPMLTSFNEEPTYMCARGADPDKIPGQQLSFYCKFNHAKLLRICFPAATVSSRGPGTQHMSTSHLLDKFVYLTICNWELEFYIYSSSNIQKPNRSLFQPKDSLLQMTLQLYLQFGSFCMNLNPEGLSCAEFMRSIHHHYSFYLRRRNNEK